MATETVISKYANPQQECDLVMKGGATSGLVYPRAVLELARQPEQGEKKAGYRFRSIGGTSAGAVAAAFTAAAEYNRDRGGFEKLHEINLKLQGADGEERPLGEGSGPTPPAYLRDLFQGSKATQPLLNILIRVARYIQDVKTINEKPGSLLWRIPAYLGLVLQILKASAVPGIWKGRLYGVLAGVLLAALLAGIIGVWPWLMTGFWAAFSWDLTVLGILLGLAGLVVGGLAAGLYGLYRIAMTEVPRNLFGICCGLRDPQNAAYSKDQPAVMEWLHDSIQEIAGRGTRQWDEVLTFAALRSRNIVLEVMVTNISEGRPYVLPFNEPFIFCKQDFDKLFPEPIVTNLTRSARKIRGVELPQAGGFYFLPKSEELPVAVAARLSMSFPLLFSSVPLYALPLWVRERIEDDEFRISDELLDVLPMSLGKLVERDTPVAKERHSIKSALQKAERWRNEDQKYAPKREDLIPHWFSDGGIASNFPIHFFDQWLPKSPTFGITLRYLPDYLFAAKKNADEERATKNYLDSMERMKEPPAQNLGKRIQALHDRSAKSTQGPSGGSRPDVVVLPRPQDTVPLEWQHICYPDTAEPRSGAVPGFLWAVIKTMQNYRDNSQAALPSYRERVVQVRLKPDEGGFNLAMGKTVIEGLVLKGQSAGEKLDREFNKQHHQWGRLRVLVSELDEKFRKIRGDKRDEDFEALLRKQQDDSGYPFRELDATWCQEVRDRLQALRTAMDQWQAHPQIVPLDAGAPSPVLRVTPNV
jgi:predicted acylesterase/phospholipase RssA